MNNWGECNGGQWNKNNIYCPECHVFNNIPHKKNCLGKKVKISATARIPKKNASEKVWKAFYDKFVLKKDLIAHFNQKTPRNKWVKESETRKIQNKLNNK